MNKVLLCSASLVALFLSPTLLAQTSLYSAIEQCRTEQNALKRLVCYDEIKTPKAPVAAATTAAATNRNEEASITRPATTNDFGLENKKVADTGDQISAIVSKIRYSPRKEMIIEFDNGQVWRQTDSGTYPIKVGERHFIKRGMLGAFYLGNDNNNRTLKVKREE